MQFDRVAGLPEGPHVNEPDPPWGSRPTVGSIPETECRTLVETLRGFTTIPDICYFCLWDGCGNIDTRFYKAGSCVRAPHRAWQTVQRPAGLSEPSGPPHKNPMKIGSIFNPSYIICGVFVYYTHFHLHTLSPPFWVTAHRRDARALAPGQPRSAVACTYRLLQTPATDCLSAASVESPPRRGRQPTTCRQAGSLNAARCACA